MHIGSLILESNPIQSNLIHIQSNPIQSLESGQVLAMADELTNVQTKTLPSWPWPRSSRRQHGPLQPRLRPGPAPWPPDNWPHGAPLKRMASRASASGLASVNAFSGRFSAAAAAAIDLSSASGFGSARSAKIGQSPNQRWITPAPKLGDDHGIIGSVGA